LAVRGSVAVLPFMTENACRILLKMTIAPTDAVAVKGAVARW